MRSFPDKASFEEGIKVRKTAWRDNFRWKEEKKKWVISGNKKALR